MKSSIYKQSIASSVLILIIFLTSPIEADHDNGKCKELKKLDYEYHGTKTIYEDARKFLKKADDDHLPIPFDDDTLEKEDRELREEDSCVPLAFYFVGRHSARFPDAEDIEKYNRNLYELIQMIKSNGRCAKELREFANWRSKMEPKHDNLITELGGKEERDIARRFKRIYPEFFNTNSADIKIGVTKKWRTAQTGAQFLKEVEGFKIDNCNSETLPTNDLEHADYNLDKVLEAACYKQMIFQYEKSALEFHKQCEKIAGESKIEDPRIKRVKDPSVKRPIIERVAKKLNFDNSSMISPEMLDSIYNMCKFENALSDSSIWCNLFEKKDVQALEYIEDVNTYIKNAYGPRANPRQSCPLVADLLQTFRNATELGDQDKRRAYFYFSHAGPMKRLLATFNMFKDDDSFSDSRISDFERELKVPKRRHWRTSVISPFSANLAFIMYRCQKRGKPMKYKILTTVTERPVKLGGCKDTDCNSEKFFATYDSLRSCDMRKICNPMSSFSTSSMDSSGYESE